MNKKRKTSAGRSPHLGKIKLALTAGALSMTMGFWVLFSNQTDQRALAQSAQAVRLELPVVDSGAGLTANPNDVTALSQFEQGFRLLLGGSQPAQSRPQVTTRTRSSR